MIERVGLADRRHHRPSQLSGGQQQRVAVARALVGEPAVLFADEPTGNLDSHASAEVLDLLRDAVDSFGQTIVMVTHDPRAAAIADRVLFLADGRIAGDLADPTEASIVASAVRGDPMIRLALRGLLARRGRTVMTALAIVLGVGMISAALTVSDTMLSAADSLSSCGLRRHRRRRRRAPRVQHRREPRRRRRRSPPRRSRTVRAVPQVGLAVGDILDQARLIDRHGKVIGDEPVLRDGL